LRNSSLNATLCVLARDADARLRHPLRRRPRALDPLLPGRAGHTAAVLDRGYAEFETEGAKFALYARAHLPELIGQEAPADRAPWPLAEIAFFVEDPDAEHDRLRDVGVAILAPPTDRPSGERTLHVSDPDSNVIELTRHRHGSAP
jgi:lactoylglutathione lyase